MKEVDQMKTSSEELKSRSNPERPLLKVFRWILACQYAILAFIIILIFSGQFPPSMRKLHTDTKANNLKSLTHSSSILEPVRGISSVTKVTNVKTFGNHHEPLLLERIHSNPFRLSKNEIMQQIKSAKIPSLRNRVKRFACWHSCFGQFRRKAFRTLYPKTVITPSPTPLPPVTTVSEEPENPDKKDKNKDVKRETLKDGTNAPEITPLPGNNDLSDGEPKAGLDVNGTNSKPNTTDFFKLKTKEKESVKLSNDSSSTSATDQHHSTENPSGNESGSEKKATSKDESGRNPKAVVVQSQELSESEDGDGYEESESPERTENESSISVSEEAIEDKGDGIDKKDMEAEKSR